MNDCNMEAPNQVNMFLNFEGISPHAQDCVMVGLLALLVYTRTLCRTVYVGDSGELTAAVYTMGIAHPPGYPLYILMGKAFCVLVGKANPALRLNLFSAFCAAFAVGAFDLVFQEMGFSRWIAASTALTVAFGASLWSQATIARVYAPAAGAMSLVYYFSGRWVVDPTEVRWLSFAGGFIGAGAAFHPMVLAMLPAMVVMVAIRRPILLGEFRGVIWIAWILPGLLLYLWVPLRALSHPRVRWGNLTTRRELFRYFFRGAYWKFRYVRAPWQLGQVAIFYLFRAGKEYGVLGGIAIVGGIAVAGRASPALLAMVLVIFAGNAAFMILHGRREDIFYWPRYMIAGWLALAIPMAWGWSWGLGFLPHGMEGPAALLLPLVAFTRGFSRRDLSRHRYALEYGSQILRDLPENSALIARDDNVMFPLMYLKYVEKVRPDVKLIDQAAREAGALTFNPRRDRVYCTHWEPSFVCAGETGGPGLKLVAEGLAYRIMSGDAKDVPRDLLPDSDLTCFENERIPRDYMTRRLLAHACIMRAERESRRDKEACRAWCIKAADLAHDCDAIQQSAGVILIREGLADLANDFFKAGVKIQRSGDFWTGETG